jgi:crotonobetainyl-CoA:carnitine CoA-transferase CaiB-like acyl-CoA transferase
MYAAAGGLIAHYHRELTGIGQQVDVSLQAGLLWALANAPAFWATNKTTPRRAGGQVTGRSITGATMQALYPCKDGYINFIIYGGAAGRRSNQALIAWLVEEGLAGMSLTQKDWDSFNIAESTQDEIDEIEGPAAALFRRITKAEFLEQGFRRGMLGYPVANAQDILGDPHLRARDFWRTVAFPALGRVLQLPGGFARFSEATVGPTRPAPTIGQHNREIYAGELNLSVTELKELAACKVI